MHIIQMVQEQHAIYFGYAFFLGVLGKFDRNGKVNASLSDRDRSRFSGDRDQYIKENTEVIRQSYILNNNG